MSRLALLRQFEFTLGCLAALRASSDQEALASRLYLALEDVKTEALRLLAARGRAPRRLRRVA